MLRLDKVGELSPNKAAEDVNLIATVVDNRAPTDENFRELVLADSTGSVVVKVGRDSGHFSFFTDMPAGTTLFIKRARLVHCMNRIKVEIVRTSSILVQSEIHIQPNTSYNVSQVEFKVLEK